MHITDFGKNEIDFLLQLYKEGELTKKTQRAYKSAMSYYFGTWFLLDAGMIKLKETRHKLNVFELTKKGKEFVKLIIKIQKLLEGGNDDEG